MHAPHTHHTHTSLEFGLVLQYMYEGHVEFNPNNSIPLLAMANYYLIKPLKKLASDYIIANITR